MREAILLATCLLAASCSPDPGPPVAVADLRLFAPLPGSPAGVAYMVVENRTAAPITIHGARSPQFASVEMHETLMEDGVMKMRPLTDLVIDARDSAVFERGGRHFMLIGAKPDVTVGTSVTLEISHDSGLLIVAGTLQSRARAE